MKQYKVKATPLFAKDLATTIYYIRHIKMNKKAAIDLRLATTKAIVKRSFCANAFETVTDKTLKQMYRRIYIGNYIVFYTITGSRMILQRFLYGSSDHKKKIKINKEDVQLDVLLIYLQFLWTY